MPSPKIFRIVCVLSRISHFLSISIYPISFNSKQTVFYISRIKSIKKTILLGFVFLGFVLTVVELIASLFSTSKINLIRFLFCGFVIVTTTAAGIFGLGFHTRANAFCCVLNVIVKNSKGLLHQALLNYQPSYNRQDILLLVLILYEQAISVITFLVLLPLADIVLAISNQNFSLNFASFQLNITFNIFIVLIKLPTYCIACLWCMLNASIWVVLIKELTDSIKDLHILLKHETENNLDEIYSSSLIYYRQIQVFSILANECLQAHCWPAVEFIGSGISIGLCYTLVKYPTLFNKWIQISLVGTLIIVLLFICVAFDFGSQSLLISSKVLRLLNDAATRNKGGVKFKKVIKSFQPVAMRVGQFHKIDRKRGPSLIRYILQRTVLLLLKSKDITSL